MYTDDLFPSLNSSSFSCPSPTLSEKSFCKEFNMPSSASSTPIINSSTIESKDQISNIVQRANELQLVVQKLIKTHVPEKNRSLLFPSLNEPVKIKGLLNSKESDDTNNNNNNISPNCNENEQQLLLLLKQQKDQNDLISSQYDYDSIKDILNRLLFYNDICAIPPYFREIYDTAHKDGMLNVGIDAEDFLS